VEGQFLSDLQSNSPLGYALIPPLILVPNPDPTPGEHIVATSGPNYTSFLEKVIAFNAAPNLFASWVVGSGLGIYGIAESVSGALSAVTKLPLALFDQAPLLRLLGQNLDLELVQQWAAAGGKLRFATVGLESGRLRYVTCRWEP
jgi:hypothetical protein